MYMLLARLYILARLPLKIPEVGRGSVASQSRHSIQVTDPMCCGKGLASVIVGHCANHKCEGCIPIKAVQIPKFI